jgi:hypothetical protein
MARNVRTAGILPFEEMDLDGEDDIVAESASFVVLSSKDKEETTEKGRGMVFLNRS